MIWLMFIILLKRIFALEYMLVYGNFLFQFSRFRKGLTVLIDLIKANTAAGQL